MEHKILLESILENLDEGVFVVDNNARVTFFNEPASDIAGVSPEEAIGKTILDIFPGLSKESSTFYKVLKTREPMIDYVQTYHNNKGRVVKTVTSTIPLFKDGAIVGAMELYRPLDSYVELTEKIASLHTRSIKSNEKTKTVQSINGNGTRYTFDHMIGNSEGIQTVKKLGNRVADSDSPILIYGETGTGKELLVQGIHNSGKHRSKNPFIALNCAAIPATLLEGILFGTSIGSFTGARDKAGLFEIANGGTLFLDEINSMPLELQAKLLRVIQEGVIRRVGDGKTFEVDVRIVASSNVDPMNAVENGMIREDLYYRLNVIALNLPPLRERKEDIPVLVSSFINHFNLKLNKSITTYETEFMDLFTMYHWPGNVRELSCVIERIMNFTLSDRLEIKDIPAEFKRQLELQRKEPVDVPGPEVLDHKNGKEQRINLKEKMDLYEKQIVIKSIQNAGGNCSEAARLLGIPRQTLHNKIKKHGIIINTSCQ